MGHAIKWANAEKTVILQQYTENATKEDLYHLAKESNRMLSTVSHTVHLIVDERAIDLVLNSADLQYLEKLTPANQGAVVVIVQTAKLPYKKVVHRMGSKVAPHAFGQPYYTDSLEDGRRYLEETVGIHFAPGQTESCR